ncbi:MAG: glycosyltransferase family 4 protein [Nitrosarchaeum sp.]|nr:glycosyltransferase family 4 protein [Nitrosarchaeum sp.]
MKSRGGVARYVGGIAKYLASKNDEVIIVSLYADRNLYKNENGIKIVDLADEKSLPQSVNFWLNLKKIQKKFAELVKSEKPDIILFNDFPATLWAQKFNGIPVLCYTYDIHMLYTDTYINNLPTVTRWLWRIIRIFVRIYDKQKWNCFNQVITDCVFMSMYIEKTYKKKTDVIYVGTDTDIFSPPVNTIKKRAILAMGDLKVRRADFVLEACGKLSKKRKDFKIWIVGNKEEDTIFFKKIIKKYDLDDMVEFYGTINDDLKLSKIYAESLVFAYLVKESAFGLSAAEAMACQTPVISWKPSGLEELIQDGVSGFNIEENNYDTLIKHIEIFLDNPDLSVEMGKKARLRVQSFVERNHVFKELKDLLDLWVSKVNSSRN